MKKSLTTIYFTILGISLLLVSCLDEYNPPEITESETILVVEGNISDVETNIRLTSTSPLDAGALITVEDAIVSIESENGGTVGSLENTGGGFYTLKTNLSFNDSYRIKIEAESETYFSEYLNLLLTPPIDSVGWEEVDDVFQVHVSTHDNSNQTQYYLWNFEETWQYRSRFPSNYEFVDDGLIPRKEQISTCWRSQPSTSILVATTVNLTENIVSKQPLIRIIPQDNLKLSNRYSILVKQFALSEDAYNFWELLKRNSESVGTFFDPQPSQLPSNIECTSDPSKSVIGYISASQQREQRIFVRRSDLPFRNIPFAPISFCEIDTIENTPDAISQQFKSGINLPTFELFNFFTGQIEGYESVPRGCADCRLFGGENVEPDFWRN